MQGKCFDHKLTIGEYVEYLKTLDQNATISSLNVSYYGIEQIYIKHSSELYEEEIEAVEGRLSNQSKKTDYYIL